MQTTKLGSLREATHLRRLFGKLLSAFDQACDQGDVVVAGMLLDCWGRALRRSTLPVTTQRSLAQPLLAAHERLWCLRHANEADLFVRLSRMK